MHQAIIIGTVQSLWTWLYGRYQVPQHVFLVVYINHILTVMPLKARRSVIKEHRVDVGRRLKHFNFISAQ